jgi:uncharacterized protein YehS (DUF1456 family)
MTNNQILIKLQSILGADEKQMLNIFSLSNFDLSANTLNGYLKEQSNKEFLDCGINALGHFLDGLIAYKRGPSDKKNDEEIRLNNNQILKKIRIAYELKEVDMYAIFDAVDIEITKSELGSLFRKEGHKNFRACPDSILQLFLDGLEICENELD